MWKEVLDIIVMPILGIISTDSEYLVIFLALNFMRERNLEELASVPATIKN